MVASASRLLFVCARFAATGALVAVLVTSAHAQPVTQPFTFSLVQHTMPLVTHGTLALGDVDNDGDLDVFLSGLSDEGEIVAGLYLYEGKELRDGVTTFVFEAAPMTRVAFASAAWGDYDGDGDLDLISSGSRTSERPYDLISVLYRNDGGRLVPTDASLEGFHSGAAKWLDFDNDGDLDLLLGGEDAEGRSRSILYRNDGGTFEDAEAGLPGLAYGSAAVGDADGDGDLDLALAGLGENGAYTNVFRNDGGTLTPLDAWLEPALFGPSSSVISTETVISICFKAGAS